MGRRPCAGPEVSLLRSVVLVLALLSCARRPPQVGAEPEIERQAELAATTGPDQTLEKVRLASMARAAGDDARASAVLRDAVTRMQDFRAEGQLRATIGAEDRKEWKGDPYEKMMAFFLLGSLLYADGDSGNALAMTKSAILADTGTSELPYRADFVPAFLLQALAYVEVGERTNAERSIDQAIDALYLREATGMLSTRLDEVEIDGDIDIGAENAARALLLTALPGGLMAHPRDLPLAIDGALSRATDLRRLALDGDRGDRPDALSGLSRRDLRNSLEALEPLVRGWHGLADGDGLALVERLSADENAFRGLLDGPPPRLVLWIETGTGPIKVAEGRYGEIQRVLPGEEGHQPEVRIDGALQASRFVESISWQAQTRGSRRVDGFLRGKAVFKDAAPLLGYAAIIAGDVARATQGAEDSGAIGTALYVLGAATWVAGAVANPRADTRAWQELPDQLYLVTADPEPGRHVLSIDGREITLDVPDRGTVSYVVPTTPPFGATSIGRPCVRCESKSPPNLAIPAESSGGTP
jgi:hypothetical protein